jgi:hypothetical protein
MPQSSDQNPSKDDCVLAPDPGAAGRAMLAVRDELAFGSGAPTVGRVGFGVVAFSGYGLWVIPKTMYRHRVIPTCQGGNP